MRACDAAFRGTVPPGGSCISSAECASNGSCQNGSSNGTSCDGRCVATPPDDSCLTGTPCTHGQVCDPPSGVCVPPVPPGGANEPCGAGESCQPGLFCDASQGVASCQPVLNGGALCFTSNSGCAAGLACVPDRAAGLGTCLPYRAEGEACSTLFQCGGEIGPLLCDLVAGVCVRRPSTGPCVGGGSSGCDLLSSFCDLTAPNGPACTPYKAIGATCSPTQSECGSFVSGALCRPLAPNSGADQGTCAWAQAQACTP